ncbi:MAG: hypothetical protein QOF99_4513 [Pseudonocardiales bacterium]|jgi:uncharacterized protein YbjT (DUF2867 family)|nr:hypothetical protein [Pseudonocardiales bacterium]
MILVTGATGNVGGSVVRQLLDAGENIRALTRDPGAARLPAGVDVVGGDLADPSTLAGVFDGIDRMFLFPVPATATAVTELAVRAGVRRVAVLSSSAVTQPGDNMVSVMHRTVEDAVVRSGLDATFVRPGGFATNTLSWAPSVRAEGVVRAPYPGAAMNSIHEADIAAVATTALLDDKHVGAAYQLTGPASITQAEQVRAIAAATGREVRFEELTPERARAAMAQVMPAEIADLMLGYLAGSVDTVAEVLPTVEQVTGRPARTYAEWAADHAADFTPAQ